MSKYKFEVKIEVEGNNHDAVVEAMEEALRRFKAGNVMGFDRTDTSRFSFEQKENMDFCASDFYAYPKGVTR